MLRVKAYVRMLNGRPVRVKSYMANRDMAQLIFPSGKARPPMAATRGMFPGERNTPGVFHVAHFKPSKPVKPPSKVEVAGARKTAERAGFEVKPPHPPHVQKALETLHAAGHEAKPIKKKEIGQPSTPKKGVGRNGAERGDQVKVVGRRGSTAARAGKPTAGRAVAGKRAETGPSATAPKMKPAAKPSKAGSASLTTHDLTRLRSVLSKIATKGRPDGAGTESDPIYVDGDIDKAVALLGEGKHVRMAQVDEVATLLSKLRDIVADAKEKGEEAPDYDLCKVSVPRTNLFCARNKGIARINMPQFGGKNVKPGSVADSLPRDKKGEVDTSDLFREMLKEKGIKSTLKTVKASHLRASQNQLVGAKVAGMSKAMGEGKVPEAPIFVTRDGYIIDGHHRWASKVALDLEDNHLGDVDMQVEMIDLDIGTALDLANAFTKEAGILPKGTGAQSEGATAVQSHLQGVAAKAAKSAPKGRLHAARTNPLKKAVAAIVPPGGGASIRLDGKSPTTGYMVSDLANGERYPSTEFLQPQVRYKKIRDFVEKNAAAFDDPDTYVGLWHDPETGDICLDVSHNISDRAAAIDRGKRENQQAIYDVEADNVIDTGGTGKQEGVREAVEAVVKDVGGGKGRVRAKPVRRGGNTGGAGAAAKEAVAAKPNINMMKRADDARRQHRQTPSNFTNPVTKKPMSKSEIGDTFETLFHAKAAEIVKDKFGGDLVPISHAEGGARNTPLDFQLKGDKPRGVELKTLSISTPNQKTAIKSAEIKRKLDALAAQGPPPWEPLLIVQVVDPETGSVHLYSYDTFASKAVSKMEEFGAYDYGTDDFRDAWDKAGYASKVKLSVDDEREGEPQEGDLVIEIGPDGKPVVYTQGPSKSKKVELAGARLAQLVGVA